MRRKTREFSFTVVYEPLEEGGYAVVVPALPGLVTYGRTFEEARNMARDSILCHIEGLRKDREPIPEESSLIQEKLVLTA